MACGAATAPAAAAPSVHAARHARLPLRDHHATAHGPRRGWAFACAKPASAAEPSAAPWISGATWDRANRPVVDGATTWPGAAFDLTRDGRLMRFAGNALPRRTPTGVFPPVAGDDAAPFARDDAALEKRSVSGVFRRKPKRRRRASCIAAAQPVAVATDGVPILPPFTAAGAFDAGAREVTDRCGGRTDSSGLYAYVAGPRCLGKRRGKHAHSGLVGYARDGFRVYGPRGAGGKPLRSRDLDRCHGHTHVLTIHGKRRRVYHYHLTPDFPYAVGCFRGRPSGSWAIGKPAPPPPLPPSPVPRVTGDPALFPAFDPDITDYVVRCKSGTPESVSVSSEAPVAVDGHAAQSGDRTTKVALEPEQAFAFTWYANQGTRTYHVRCLPEGFYDWTTERHGTPQAQWYVVTPSKVVNSWVAIFDTNGVPVWWRSSAPEVAIDAKLLPDGNLEWEFYEPFQGFRYSPGGRAEVRRLDGSLVRTIATVGNTTDFHEGKLLPNGDFLLMTYRPRDHVNLSAYGGPSDATVLDGEIQEIDKNGVVAWSWSTEGHIALAESQRWWPNINATPVTLPDNRKAYDIVHMNSVEPDGDGFVVSLRHTDAVYRVDKATKNVQWKLGGTPTGQSLTVEDDPNAGPNLFGGQHDVRLQPDGTLTVHDNRTTQSSPAPRAARYRIDVAAGTATLVEQIADPDVPGSFCCGSARRLPGGDWVMSWGGGYQVTELTPGGERPFRITFENGVQSYRAQPLLPGALSRSALRAGMDAMHPRP